jgi:hypothetical protein
MSTLHLQTASPYQVWPIPGLARVGAFFSLVANTFAEAQQSMREAGKKYPFAGL